MYTVLRWIAMSSKDEYYYVMNTEHPTKQLFVSPLEKDCQIFAHMMNKAEKEMHFLDGMLPVDEGVRYLSSKEIFWQKTKKHLDNDAKLREKEAVHLVHLSKGDILGPTYCGIPFDFVPHSSTMVHADVTCQKCLESLPSYYKSVVVKKDEKEDKSCNENKVNFREFI